MLFDYKIALKILFSVILYFSRVFRKKDKTMVHESYIQERKDVPKKKKKKKTKINACAPGGVCISCCFSCNRRVTLIQNPTTSHDRGKEERVVTTTNRI